jgi:hypothetical protein
MEPQLYFHGYDYSTGVLAVGAPCVAPILEVLNKLPEELRISWLNRSLIGDDVLQDAAQFCNAVVAGPGELALITNFYASAGFYRSILCLETASSGRDLYIFNFSADAGYYLRRLTRPCCGVPEGPLMPYSKSLVEYPSFAPQFCGSQKPRWKDCVLFPVVVRCAPADVSPECSQEDAWR